MRSENWILLFGLFLLILPLVCSKIQEKSNTQEFIVRDENLASVPLTEQVSLAGGKFFFGSQLDAHKKISPTRNVDGAKPRRLVTVQPFSIDIDCVTNEQFAEFILATQRVTDAETFKWSFVLDPQANDATRSVVDGPNGMGRVKTSPHWMGVVGATWYSPYGPLDVSALSDKLSNHPVVHVSYNDATAYCAFAGRRLPTEREWEYAARGGLVNATYPWGDHYRSKKMNVWEGEFPKKNTLKDGYLGTAPVLSYEPNDFGIYNSLGNVWEWVQGGNPQERITRGGSFIDSIDGRYNHLVSVATKHVNSGDSTASNVGFRCAKTLKFVPPDAVDRIKHNDVEDDEL